MDFDRLVAQSGDDNGNKTRLTNAFFTMFPPAAQEEFDLVVRWIRFNRSSAIIFRWEDPGAWDHFQKSPNKSYDNAVIIVSRGNFMHRFICLSLIHMRTVPRILL